MEDRDRFHTARLKRLRNEARMMKVGFLAPTILGLATLWGLPPTLASWKGELERLVRTERAFSAASVSGGIKAAFLQFLADDGILFRPGPVPGKKWMAEQPPSEGELSWRPVFADLSWAGDLGYTTGPYEFRMSQGPRHGHYVTVWKKQPNGAWKFVVDTGIRHPPPGEPIAERWAGGGKAKWPKTDQAKEKSALLEFDEDFASASRNQGAPTAYAAYISSDARVYRNDRSPASGRREVTQLLAGCSGTLTWRPEQADAARSGDLGYTWGKYEMAPGGDSTTPRTGYYLRIWKKQADGAWRVVLDILN